MKNTTARKQCLRIASSREGSTPAPLGVWSCTPQDDSDRVFYAVGHAEDEACASVADEIAGESGARVHPEGAIFGDVTVTSPCYMADVIVRRV